MLWYRDRSDAEEQMTSTQGRLVGDHRRRQAHLPQQPRTRTTAVPHHPTSMLQEDVPTTGFGLRNWFNTGAVDLSLVKATCLSQATAFVCAVSLLSIALMVHTQSMSSVWDVASLHWNSNQAGLMSSSSSATTFHSLLDWKMTSWRLVEGVLAAVPLISMGTMVEHSEHRSASHVHFSVTNTVIALFGRRRRKAQEGSTPSSSNSAAATTTSTAQVILFSLGIAIVSALSEELIFRGFLPGTTF